ncbi:hypothetical protein L227DRAFT_292578 [Lentinus tigrinus ALCF2SS1-6]|uniref:Uncharacterized protein n=1 Tax=Lentinus tigrinus ALCF2SS1-6 TaxID=1328759 RepID=A0A5C2RXQ2_9APHY|nr:hypothetical protein L227DRAFT_292578 [Lentinus tigrinus ALCF2SS1-6]
MVVLNGEEAWLAVLVMARGRGGMGVWEGGSRRTWRRRRRLRALPRLYYPAAQGSPRPLEVHAEIDDHSRDVISCNCRLPRLPFTRSAVLPSRHAHLPHPRLRQRRSPHCWQRRPARGRRSQPEWQPRHPFGHDSPRASHARQPAASSVPGMLRHASSAFRSSSSGNTSAPTHLPRPIQGPLGSPKQADLFHLCPSSSYLS